MLLIDINKFFDILTYDSKAPLMFNSGFFLFFFIIVALGFSFIKGNIKARSLYLMFVSLYFYYKSSGIFLLVLLFTTISDYFISQEMNKTNNQRMRLRWLILSLVVNISMLSFFKYTNFFGHTLGSIFNFEFTPYNIILPIGISFFTFQSLSYTIDVYYRKIEPLKKYTDYAFYVSFFPQLVAGPIVRAKDFIPQISLPTIITKEMFGRGVFLIISGLFKKVVISDYISINFVDRIFDNPTLYSGFENLMGVYGYALQIYCDFSGYSDIAIGLALLLGFKFNLNFDSPYKSSSITEFWRRWHMSLSGWLRDYLYIPLGGNKKGTIRTYANLLTTMILGGLWHGASLQFVFWGAWHGVLLALDKLRMKYLSFNFKNEGIRLTFKSLGVILTFHLVCFGWIFFRASTFESAQEIISQITDGLDFSLIPQFVIAYKNIVILMLLGFILHIMPNSAENWCYNYFSRMSLVTKAAVMALFIFFIIQVSSSEVMPFIYFQF